MLFIMPVLLSHYKDIVITIYIENPIMSYTQAKGFYLVQKITQTNYPNSGLTATPVKDKRGGQN